MNLATARADSRKLPKNSWVVLLNFKSPNRIKVGKPDNKGNETIMHNIITTTENIWLGIEDRLRDPSIEHLVFGFLGLNKYQEKREFLLFNTYLPSSNEYKIQNIHLVSLKAESAIKMLARSKDCNGIIDIHNHPKSFSADFSSIDREGMEKEAQNIFDFKKDNYLIRMVISSRSLKAEVTHKGIYPSWEPIDKIKIIGERGFRFIFPSNGDISQESFGDAEKHRRTLEFYPKEGLEILLSIHFGVIGVGGTGSAFLNLIKFFARKITLIDGDRVEKHNSGRLFNYISGDEGKLKVVSHKRELKRYNPHIQIKTVRSMFPSPRSLKALKECDILIVAPDNNFTRYKASEFASRYMKPLLELGSGVRMKEGRLTSIGCQVRFQLPTNNGKCMICNGMEAEDLVSPEFTEYKRQIGYVEDENSEETSASVVTINSMAALIGLRILLDYFGGYTGRKTPNHVFYDDLTLNLIDLSDSFHKNPECPICGKGEASIFGRGDQLPKKIKIPQSRRIFRKEHNNKKT